MKPRDPQEMEKLGPSEPWWEQQSAQEIEDWERFLDEMEEDNND